MSKKILFVASIPSHLRSFHLPYIKWLKDSGYEIHTATHQIENLPCVDKAWNISIERSPYRLKNVTAFNQLKQLIDKENYELIHCHTPMASVLTRLASLGARKKGTKVLYTAHGFHFYKGAFIINWLIYYPIEILLSYFTDAIICINNEDYNRISKKGSHKCDYYIIPGIGVEKKKFYPVSLEEKIKYREEKGLPANKFIIIYSAEFIPRKNHKFILDAIVKNKEKLNDLLFIFAGNGEIQQELENFVLKNRIEDFVNFIGFRKDIDEIYKLSDIGVSSSKQEGLPLNIVEEMMCGLPVIGSNIRGHIELIDNDENGYLFKLDEYQWFIDRVLELKEDNNKYIKFKQNSLAKAKKFSLENSMKAMTDIYKNYLSI